MIYKFEYLQDNSSLLDLKRMCLNSLNSAADGMWQSFRDMAEHWSIRFNEDLIGYACLDNQKCLIQFYIIDQYLHKGKAILSSFVMQNKVKSILVGSNNPSFFTLALDEFKTYSVDTFLFRDLIITQTTQKDGILRPVLEHDLSKVVEFLHTAMGAPKAWLGSYISDLSQKGAIYLLEFNDEILGTCEVRRSATQANYADIGMVVSPNHRNQGYGTYLLSLAKNIAINQGLSPICSCEKENIASLKAIQKCGFVSRYRLLRFEC